MGRVWSHSTHSADPRVKSGLHFNFMCAGNTRPSKAAVGFPAAAPWILLIRFAAYSSRDFKITLHKEAKFNSPNSQAESGRLPLTCNSDRKITELIRGGTQNITPHTSAFEREEIAFDVPQCFRFSHFSSPFIFAYFSPGSTRIPEVLHRACAPLPFFSLRSQTGFRSWQLPERVSN